MIIFVRKDKIISIIFRNFAEKSAKLLRLGIKRLNLLFCSRLFVTLHMCTKGTLCPWVLFSRDKEKWLSSTFKITTKQNIQRRLLDFHMVWTPAALVVCWAVVSPEGRQVVWRSFTPSRGEEWKHLFLIIYQNNETNLRCY